MAQKELVKNEKEIIDRLIQFNAETSYLDIPKDVLEHAKVQFLKMTAGVLVGTAKPSGRKMARMIQEQRLPEDVGVIGCGFKTSLWQATFAHAFFAHASELEDNRIVAWGERVPGGGASWDVTVIPLVLSMIEKYRPSGKSLLEALAVGLEVHARTCLFSAEDRGMLMFPGAVGPALTAARIMGLTPKQMGMCMGLATSSANLTHLNFATDAHYSESAMSALQSIMAADMAKENMTSSSKLLTYLTRMLGQDYVKPEKLIKDLGKKWIFTETWIKKYPVCFLMHRQIDNLIELRGKYHIKPEDVEMIEVEVSPADNIQCNRAQPHDEEDLQFSFQNSLAAALLEGDVTVNHVTKEAVNTPALIEYRKKVKVVEHEGWPTSLDDAMSNVPAKMVIKLKSGKTLSAERMRVLGSQENPISSEQLKQLYVKFTQGILSDANIEKTYNIIVNMEGYNDLQELMDILVFRHKV
jgi:2-methylcitrate dehydratase PrpD